MIMKHRRVVVIMAEKSWRKKLQLLKSKCISIEGLKDNEKYVKFTLDCWITTR